MKLKTFITSGFDLQECVDRAAFLYEEWRLDNYTAEMFSTSFQIDSRDKFTYMLSVYYHDIQT